MARALGLDGELRREVQPYYSSAGYSVGFQIKPPLAGEETKLGSDVSKAIDETPAVNLFNLFGRGNIRISPGLSYDNDLFSPDSFEMQTPKMTFSLEMSSVSLQEYSRLLPYNAHRETHGSYEALAKGIVDLILVAREPILEGKDRISQSMSGTFDMAERNNDSIAYSVFYYERIMNPRAALKPLAINGVHPTSRSIEDRTYPLTEPVYVVTRQGIASDSSTFILRNWLLSKDGQKLIAQSGYVPIQK